MLVRDGERALLARYEKFRKANEARHDKTRQRTFERSFESRDLPDSRAAVADASDMGWYARAVAREVDKARRTLSKRKLLKSAVARVPPRPKIHRKLLWAVYRNGRKRYVTMDELKVSKATYWRGLKFLLNFGFGQCSRG